jgi:aldose 1-epimerase
VTVPSGEQFELTTGAHRAVVVEAGGGIREWQGVLLGYGADEMCSSGRGQVLAPWPNRLAGGRYEWDGKQLQLPVNEVATGSAIHGLVRWAAWRAIDRTPASVVLEHVLHPQPGYPFSLHLRVEYRLAETGLTVRTEAKNTGDRDCPFGAGHHPYLLAPSGRVDDLVLDGELVGAQQLDETEHVPGGWRIELGEGEVAVWADEAWPWRQVFTGDLPDIGRRGLAVEPMTCPPQAFGTGDGVVRLEPGERWSGEWGIEVA